MSDLLLIPVCILAGVLFSKIKAIPDNSYKTINSLIIYVTLPAFTLLYIPQIKIGSELIFPAAVAWITFLLSAFFFIALEKLFKWDKRTTGSLILTGGLANTAFVGFPVLAALFGEDGLKLGVIIDQAGSFLVLSTLGIIAASVYSSGTYSIKKITKDILTYPSFIAFILSLIMIIAGIEHNDTSAAIFSAIGKPTIILALISVGMQLKPRIDTLLWKELSCGLIYKLLIAPAVIFILYYYLFNLKRLVFQVSIMETAMPPMIMGSVLAVQFNLNPKLANLMVGIGIPVSAVTLSLWYWLVR
ncbi:MAG TPA: AEC family transporter [Ignavibacteria bacterium]|nr:AEC family transporter [Ignavibacteria bacterium]